MTKPSKLYEQLLANPGAIISFRDFERLLDAFGWVHKRTKGSHRHYIHSDVPAVLTINPDGKSAHRYQVRLLLEFVEEYGLHIEPLNEPHYHINLFWSEEDQLWIADVPDLSGCMTHGNTRAEALANAAEAIEGWIETAREAGLAIPEPRYRPAIYASRHAA